ncbi:MAG: glutamate-cysteine ligase family protein [Candidatus Nanosalina sp.]
MSVKASDSINDVLEPENEERMNEGIDRNAERVKNNDFEEPEGFTAGIETEYFIVDGDDQPISEEERDKLIGKGVETGGMENWDHELGASMAETASDPVKDIHSLEELEQAIRQPEEEMRRRLEGTEYQLLRSGANPNQDLNEVERTTEPKYVEVPDAYGEMRTRNVEGSDLVFTEDLGIERLTDEFGSEDTIDPRNSDVPATISSTQLNLQADDLNDAVEKANIGYAIAPYVTALSGNSRFVDGKDLGFSDTRVELWEKAFDIGNFEKDDIDIGKIDEYFQDFDDYIERIREQPRIVNDESRGTIDEEWRETVESVPLDVGQGMYWKDSRIKVVDGPEVKDEVIVEFRQNSTQPTADEDIAGHAFYLGRMAYEQEVGSELLDIEKVNQNRYSAMREGIGADLYDWETGDMREGEEVLQDEISKAREGLEYAGIDDPGYLDILDQRLERGLAPSDEAAEIYEERIPDGEIDEEVKREAAMDAVKSINMTDYDKRVQTV